MTRPQRADTDALTTLARDVIETQATVQRLRQRVADGALPTALARITVEQADDATIRVGITNPATGAVRWLTEFF